ncbi:D-glycerate dehydrogenase [Bacteriovorax sp. PP10]|uniref:D-glycerate dehydrogenase n=1 Tax=Bacteriovorax antarcticus TaxID=3088717 RepID=A0ABU5VZB1_9BACT|nr:D-glycerate dehydrogenase [Bacteriovorax sp. PP10]MEA9358302.1 D-glycerate dehydrogenase [Bacteriovorax sp. PP10]
MKKVYVTRDVLPDGISLLKDKGFEVEVWAKDRPMTAIELHEAAQKVDALWCTMADAINKNFLMSNSHLKIITNYAVGTNNIDKEAAAELGIIIGNTPDVLTEATAETAFGLMICASRNFKAAMKNAENGEWTHFQPKGFLGPQLKGRTLGIIGMGRIGGRLGEMAQGAFGMKIKGYKRGDNLIEFLSDLDVLSLHIPLTPETKHFIGRKEIAAMKSSAIIVNTARGDVIDQEALYEALRDKKIFSAGLDVTTPEPLPPSNPLFSLPNVMILPHIGSATFEARTEMSVMCANNIIAAFP